MYIWYNFFAQTEKQLAIACERLSLLRMCAMKAIEIRQRIFDLESFPRLFSACDLKQSFNSITSVDPWHLKW